jgi:hypothetical protein
MKPIGTIAIGLALVSGAAVAQAQTAVTRQITSEPVETVVTQGPNGTVVTRRILTPEPGVTSFAAPPLAYPPAPPLVYPPAAVQAVEPSYVEPAAPPPAPRRATASRPTTVGVSTRTHERTRSTETRRVSERPVRSATRTVVAAPVSRPGLALSPAERQVIYRTVAQREYYPVRPPVAQTEVYAPVNRYPLRTVYPADDDAYRDAGYRDYSYGDYGNPDYAYRGYAYREDHAYYRDDDLDPYHTAYRWDGVPLVVGARIPPSVPLIAVPQPVVARIPMAAPYGYAVIENRVYLVDPATGVIVAVITP